MRNFYLIFEHLPLTILTILFFCLFYDFNFYIMFLCFLFGWLIDVDHLYDYFLYASKNSIKYNLKEFLSGNYFNKSKKIIIFLHSYEISIFIIIFAIIIDEKFLFIAFAHFAHLIQDTIRNKVRLLSYFFFYRAAVRFNSIKICSHK